MKVIVAGGRDFNNYTLLEEKLILFFKNLDYNDIEIVSGCASGADSLGEVFARKNKIKITPFPADWNNLDAIPCKIKTNKYGKKYNALAGHNRNEQMAEYGDALVLFWNGKSTGSKDMLNRAEKHNLKIRIVRY